MTQQLMNLKQADTLDVQKDPANDYELWQTLKPFIGHCLTLNHDINNPLTTIIGYAEFMLEDDPPLAPNHLKHVKNILQAAERVRLLVEKLCAEKIALSEQIDMGPVIDSYQRVAKPLK